MYMEPQEQVGLNNMQFPMKFWHVMVTKLQKNKVDSYYLYCSCN